MTFSRRQFVQHGAAATLITAFPARRLWAWPGASRTRERLESQSLLLNPDDVRKLALRAVEAARGAGATYADVRLIRSVTHSFVHSRDSVVGAELYDEESFSVGVRALVNGYWGFAASPNWTHDAVASLARESVAQAKQNALGSLRHVELGTHPAATGTWVTPGLDPFSISIEEKIDFMNGWRQAIGDRASDGFHVLPASSSMSFVREEWAMASTDGAYTTQTIYQSFGNFVLEVAARNQGTLQVSAKGLQLQRRGWDAFLEADIKSQIPRLIAVAAEQFTTSQNPIEIGRYDVVFDAVATAGILDNTIGLATQIDRALGYEANASGTSFLGPDPLERLGTFVMASPLVTVTANRSLPGGAATVKWDAEGVEPSEFTLVKAGVLNDYQTTREQAAWLAPWYQKQKIAGRSHGCAAAPSALFIPIQHTPNLALTPTPTQTSFEDLVASTRKGIAVIGGNVRTDFQATSGSGSGTLREIVDGKLGAILTRGGYLFNTVELWKNVTAVGGPRSVEHTTLGHLKGQPSQASSHTVAAVPMAVKNVSIIDTSRRA